MAIQIDSKKVSFPVGFDGTAAQYHFVVHDGTDLALADEGAVAFGILQNAPALNGIGEVHLLGQVEKLELGDTVAAGALVASNAAGEGVTATTGDRILGQALEAGVDGDIISVLTYSGGAGDA